MAEFGSRSRDEHHGRDSSLQPTDTRSKRKRSASPSASTSKQPYPMKGHRQPLDDTPICYDATLNPRRQAIAVCSPQCSFQGGYILGLLAGKFYDSPPLVNVKFYSKIKSGSSTVFRMFLSDLTHGVMVETTPKSHVGARVLDYDVCEFVARITSVDRLEEPSSCGALLRVNRLLKIIQCPPCPDTPMPITMISHPSQIDSLKETHKSIFSVSQSLIKSFTPSEMLISCSIGQGHALHIWAPREVVSSRSPKLAALALEKDMTGSHLPETFPEPASLDESDGDQFSDELYRSRAEADGLLVKMDFATVKSLKPDCVCLQILDFRYTTLKAVFTWMLTGSIHFAPVDCFDKYSFDRDRYDLLPASPRAVYHLAHYFGLESLKREAREYLLSQLTRGEAKHELKRFLALNYEEIHSMLITKVSEPSESSRSQRSHT